jgi:hypothetical protein
MPMTELRAAVDAAFVETSRGLREWSDPHAGEMPSDDEYSRCLDPAKWRIIGARADAWADALVRLGHATVEHDASIEWRSSGFPAVTRTDVVHPNTTGALSLAIGRSRIEDVADAGVVLGAVRDGALVDVLSFLPDCGCDACDRGSQPELDVLDEHIGSVASGRFRRLTRGSSVITVFADGVGAHNLPDARAMRRSGELDRILADPVGWHELTGSPWWPAQ